MVNKKLVTVVVIIAIVAVGIFVYSRYFGNQIGRGVITGSVSYPSEVLPAQRICAENIKNPQSKYCVETKDGQSVYQLEVPAGEYYVYSGLLEELAGDIKTSYRAYYNEFVLCGLDVKCNDKTHHGAFIKVTVKPGSISENINPQDWYDQSQR